LEGAGEPTARMGESLWTGAAAPPRGESILRGVERWGAEDAVAFSLSPCAGERGEGPDVAGKRRVASGSFLAVEASGCR